MGRFSRLKSDFANKPFRTPIKTRLAFQLFNHVFNDLPAEAVARRRFHGRSAGFCPKEGQASVRCMRPLDLNLTFRRR